MNIHIFSRNSINWKHSFIHYVKSRYQIWHCNFSAPTLWCDVVNLACLFGAHTFFIMSTFVFKICLSLSLFLKIYSLIFFYIPDFITLTVYPLTLPYFQFPVSKGGPHLSPAPHQTSPLLGASSFLKVGCIYSDRVHTQQSSAVC